MKLHKKTKFFILISVVSVMTFGLFQNAVLTSSSNFNQNEYLNLRKISGSNYLTYDLGRWNDYHNGTDPTLTKADAWNTIKAVLVSYHENPSKVNSQMQTMFNGGQREISFVLWFSPFAKTDLNPPSPLVVSSESGVPSDQISKNIYSVIKKAKDIGFSRIHFRFAPQGKAEPRDWSKWDEERYLETWNFMQRVREIVLSSVHGSSTRVLFDLGAELAGVTKGFARNYVRRCWEDYTSAFGVNDTFGFSLATTASRITMLIEDYDSVKVRPNAYALDIYPSPELEVYEVIQSAAQALAAKGENKKEIIIQETTYEDPLSLADIEKAKKELGLSIYRVFQWPRTREAGPVHFSIDFPKSYYTFRPSPLLVAGGVGGADGNAIWLVGINLSRFANKLVFEIPADPSTGAPSQKLYFNNIQSSIIPADGNFPGYDKIVFTLRDNQLISALDKGIFISTEDQKSHRISNQIQITKQFNFYYPTYPPAISATGIGGAKYESLWIIGDHFDSNAEVELRKNDDKIVARLSGAQIFSRSIVLSGHGDFSGKQNIIIKIPENLVGSARLGELKVIVVNSSAGRRSASFVIPPLP